LTKGAAFLAMYGLLVFAMSASYTNDASAAMMRMR